MPRKILAISSGGGHWVQLRRLSPAFDGLDVTYVSVKSEYATDVKDHPFFVIRDANRWSRISFLVLAMQLLKILWRVKPDLVITTGAAPGLMALLIAKIFSAQRPCGSIASPIVKRCPAPGVWLVASLTYASPSGHTCKRLGGRSIGGQYYDLRYCRLNAAI